MNSERGLGDITLYLPRVGRESGKDEELGVYTDYMDARAAVRERAPMAGPYRIVENNSNGGVVIKTNAPVNGSLPPHEYKIFEVSLSDLSQTPAFADAFRQALQASG
jgi:hypothetical protein